MKLMTSQRRKSAGQSTVEFALMMPVIMAFFFWIFQVNIYYTALNQTAWAAFASARTQLVLTGPGDGGVQAKDTVTRILPGSLYDGVNSDPSTLRSGGGPDGVIVKLPSLATLPYVSSGGNGLAAPLLKFDTEVSTHLGWQEYNHQKYSDKYEWEDGMPNQGGSKTVTDNNLKDY